MILLLQQAPAAASKLLFPTQNSLVTSCLFLLFLQPIWEHNSSDKRTLEKVLMCSYILDLNSCQNDCTSKNADEQVWGGGGTPFPCNFTDTISEGQNAPKQISFSPGEVSYQHLLSCKCWQHFHYKHVPITGSCFPYYGLELYCNFCQKEAWKIQLADKKEEMKNLDNDLTWNLLQIESQPLQFYTHRNASHRYCDIQVINILKQLGLGCTSRHPLYHIVHAVQ